MIKNIFQMLSRKGRCMMAAAVLFYTLYALSGTAIMVVVLDFINKLIERKSINYSTYWLLLFSLLAAKGVFSVIGDTTKHFAGFDIVEQVRGRIILNLKKLSLGFYSQERLGEVSTVIHKDVDNMEGVVGHMWSRMASDFLVALILGIGLFIVDWKMGLAMVSLLPMEMLVLVNGLKSGKALQQKNQDDLADMVSLFVEYVKGIPLLKAFRESKSFRQGLKKSAESFGESSKKSARSVAAFLGRYTLFLELSFGVMAILGIWFVYQGSLPVFTYLLFVIVSREFYKPFAGMEAHWTNYLKVLDSYRRILTLLEAPVVEQPLQPKTPKAFDIAFHKVRFFYEEGEFELQDASFHLKQGTLTALVGPSGSGKTTITNLLLRFWEPQQGHIRIGGISIQDMDYDELLGHISIVMQNVMLFADTIENNIKISNRNATRGQVITAAKKAMIHDFIMGLPKGYDTPVGENGVGLSGGQKQRISIARAFLKDSPIVILDEITSNVDPVNEAMIQRAISNLAKNRTVLVIAHHLRTIRTADNILVFDKGKIVQSGTHEILLEKGGLYKDLWESQEQAKQWNLSRLRHS